MNTKSFSVKSICFLLPVRFCHKQTSHDFVIRLDFKHDVIDFYIVLEIDIVRFQIVDHWQDHRLVLVVFCEPERGEIRQTVDMMDIALNVAFHFQRTVPVFKSEHRPPVHPEIGVQHFVVKKLGDFLVFQFFFRGEKQLHDLHLGFVGQSKFLVRVRVLSTIDCRPAQRVVWIALV